MDMCATGCVHVHVYYCILCALWGGVLKSLSSMPVKEPKSRNYLNQNRWQREISRRADRINWGRKALTGLKKHMHTADTQRKTDSQQSGDPKKPKIQSLLQAGGF